MCIPHRTALNEGSGDATLFFHGVGIWRPVSTTSLSLFAPLPPWHAEGGHGCVGGLLGPVSQHPTQNVSDVSDVVLSLAGACHPCQIAI